MKIIINIQKIRLRFIYVFAIKIICISCRKTGGVYITVTCNFRRYFYSQSLHVNSFVQSKFTCKFMK